MNLRTANLMVIAAFACTITVVCHAASDRQDRIRTTVNRAIKPIMADNGIRGMAVGIIDGDEHYLFNYGLTSAETGEPVTRDTLFELGSVSKTLTATLASYAQVSGYLSLSDPAEESVR
jgi:beta-lactamase class C